MQFWLKWILALKCAFFVFRHIFTRGEGGEFFLAHIIVDDNEMLEKAIKRFKRMVEKEGIIREFKKREYYEKPSTILNRKKKAIARKLMKKSRKGRSEY
jgi:small subunit ribosomal protein S21